MLIKNIAIMAQKKRKNPIINVIKYVPIDTGIVSLSTGHINRVMSQSSLSHKYHN